MGLKLTWRIKGQEDIDLMVLENQRIVDTMHILVERGFMDEELATTTRCVKSLRTNNQINILLTYRAGHIFSGDILEL